jgi:hypothetical protein
VSISHALATRRADETTLVDLLDAVIDRGVVVSGDVVLSVAEVDLVHLGLRLVLRGLDEPVGARSTDASARDRRTSVGPPSAATPHGDAGTAAGEPSRGTRHARAPRARADKYELGHEVGAELQRLLSAGRTGEADPDDVQRGLASLVLTLVEVLRDLMERQALRRMESGTVDEVEVERLGRTFLALRERMEELKDAFGLTDEDLRVPVQPHAGQPPASHHRGRQRR